MRISDWSSDVCSSDLYQQMMAQAQQPQQQQAQDDPRIAQLQQTIVQVQEQQLAATIIDPFKRDHPRYAELEQDIAFFLQSGKIPTSLSPSDRLSAAYDKAERINPPSHADRKNPRLTSSHYIA